jgi:hypothetical protein
MKTLHWVAALATLAIAATTFAATASAQATRTWVSGVGDDANPCSRTAPCKTFAGAISRTAVLGEINCLDPGGFGALTITKAITIDCTGVEAGVLVSGTNGFVVQAAATDVVVIKGLDIEGLGPPAGALNGIKINSAQTVIIDRCIIDGFGSNNGTDGDGIFVSSNTNIRVMVIDTRIANNANAGILVKPTSGLVGLEFNNLTIANNTFGVAIDGTGAGGAYTGNINGVVRNSVIDGNTSNGISINNVGGSAGNLTLLLDTDAEAGSSVGLLDAGGSTAMLVSNSTVTTNSTGLSTISGGLIYSYGNNRVNGNFTDGSFTSSAALR